MPIYEYRCDDCQHKLEALQKFSDARLVTCPACGKDALTKLVSAAGFQLKGSGWYQTDFRGNGGAKKPEKSDTAGAPATEGSGTKPDTPAPKTEGAPAKTESAAASPASPSPPPTTAT